MYSRCAQAARQPCMLFDQSTDGSCLRVVAERFDVYHVEIAALIEITVLIEHVSDAAAHACGKVSACPSENDDDAARHIFAAVIANAFDNRVAPLLRTAKRSPATPRMKASPPVAP